MRLIKSVARLEAAGGAAAAAEPAEVGMCWSTRETRVEAADLEPGEYIACDVTLVNELGGADQISIAERVTTDTRDLGFVFDVAGLRIGRVMELDGSLVEWEDWREERSPA